MSDHRKPWEPDTRKMGNWQSMFEQRRGDGAPPHAQPAAPAADAFDDAELNEPGTNTSRGCCNAARAL
jgi:hypothetical protein